MNRTILYAVGRPFSPLYSGLMRMRAYFYRTGIFRVTDPGVPVISVGNLTMGGTGKTPVVRYIAAMLQARGALPAIISRGYRGRAGGRVNVVSDGEKLYLDAVEAGDEPRLLAESLPGVPVLTGRDRRFPAARAVEMGADVLILDDGFQHMGVSRSVDLVLFSADTLAGNSRVFPGGDLREPVGALRRCDAFVLTNTCDANRERARRFKELLLTRFPGHPVFFSEYTPSELVLHNEGGMVKELSPDSVRNQPLFAFAGIGFPERFALTLEKMGCQVTGFAPLADHHAYTPGNLRQLFRQARQAGASACITTEKDMIKLKGSELSLPVYALRMRVGFAGDFDAFLVDRLEGWRGRSDSGL